MFQLKINFLLISLKLLDCFVFSRVSPSVNTSHGIVEGLWKENEVGRPYAAFLGVPFARPPLKEYKFIDPFPLQPWRGIWKAKKYPSQCLQYNVFNKKFEGKEDCLYLNIYSTNLDKKAMLSVIVHIHGGGFITGASFQYDPIRLLKFDIVFVSMNYRLGPLGFLSTGDTVVPGNAGLKDQSLALRWIKLNIRNFGGNPDGITLIGQSAGSASVNYHLLSPMSFGLFNKAAAYSASAFAPWALDENPLANTKILAGVVGCPNTTSEDMIKCLKNVPGLALVKGQLDLMEWKRVKIFPVFLPVVEAPNRNQFLIKNPFEIASAGEMQKLPLMLSTTSEEGLLPAAAYQVEESIFPELESRWEEVVSTIFDYKYSLEKNLHAIAARKIKKEYFGKKPVGQATFYQFIQALGDRHFVSDIGKQAELHASHSGQPVYMLRYSFTGNFSFSTLMSRTKKIYGASHMDDFLHILKAFGFELQSKQDIMMSKLLLFILYSFVTTGTPKLPNKTSWPKVKPGSSKLNYMEIRSPTNYSMKSTPYAEFGNRKFWNSLSFNENENLKS